MRPLFLLTPLREGRRFGDVDAAGGYAISTHAPAGGATRSALICQPAQRISTHAPAGGATGRPRLLYPMQLYFYSRPCGRGDHDWPATGDFVLLFLLTPLREGRPDIDPEAYPVLIISTHAPAGGATGACPSPLEVRTYFYSRPCGRGDLAERLALLGGIWISTHAPAGGATGM